jgi:hypothetical protein
VRHEDPISPLLFNAARDVLTRMFRKTKNNNLIKGLVLHILENRICILQYADYIVVMFQDNFDMA